MLKAVRELCRAVVQFPRDPPPLVILRSQQVSGKLMKFPIGFLKSFFARLRSGNIDHRSDDPNRLTRAIAGRLWPGPGYRTIRHRTRGNRYSALQETACPSSAFEKARRYPLAVIRMNAPRMIGHGSASGRCRKVHYAPDSTQPGDWVVFPDGLIGCGHRQAQALFAFPQRLVGPLALDGIAKSVSAAWLVGVDLHQVILRARLAPLPSQAARRRRPLSTTTGTAGAKA